MYYHCTGAHGACGDTHIGEEHAARLFGKVVKNVRIPTELADEVATALRESQSEKEIFARSTTMRLQQHQLLLRSTLDMVL